MSKSLNKTITFNGTINQVLEMFRTVAFLDELAKESLSHSHNIDLTDTSATVYLEIETDEIPSLLKKFVGKTVKIFDTQELPLVHLSGGETKGERTIRTSVKQARVSATVLFEDVPTGCSVTYDGKVKFDIPFGAGGGEGELLKIVIAGLDELEELGNRWLAREI